MLRYFASTENLFRFLVWAILCLILLVGLVALKVMGIKLVAVTFLLLNAIMLTAIPVPCGHYLTDVIAGAFITIGAICLVRYITKYADTKLKP